jgi:polysaccharide pyruvyl transferase CsaB
MNDCKAVICGYYGRDNSGDEALLLSLLQMLPTYVEPIVFSANPKQTQQRYGVKACPNRSLLSILKAFRQSQYFIWGGGSLMQDVTSIASPIYYAGLMGLAQIMGLRTIAWAQGIGPLNRPLSRWLTQKVLRGCQAISVRDYGSANLLSNWKMSPIIAPDPVWALNSKPLPHLWDTPAPRVAVCLRPHAALTAQKLAIIGKALAEFQQATNTFLLLVPFQPIQDGAIADALATHLTDRYQIISSDDPRELKGLFSGVEMTIGMRFHSLIMAAAEGCRCFALSYDPKVSQLMQELDLVGWELAEMPDNAQEISKNWIEYYANGEALSTDRLRSLVDRALMHRELLVESIEPT